MINLNFDSPATSLSWTDRLVILVIIIIIIISLTLDTTLLLNSILPLDDKWWLWSKVAQSVNDAGTAETIYAKLASALCAMERVCITFGSIAEFEDSDWAALAKDLSHERMWGYVGGDNLAVAPSLYCCQYTARLWMRMYLPNTVGRITALKGPLINLQIHSSAVAGAFLDILACLVKSLAVQSLDLDDFDADLANILEGLLSLSTRSGLSSSTEVNVSFMVVLIATSLFTDRQLRELERHNPLHAINIRDTDILIAHNICPKWWEAFSIKVVLGEAAVWHGKSSADVDPES